MRNIAFLALLGLSACLAACANHIVDETGGTTGGEDAGVKPSPNCPQAGGSMVEIPDMQGGSYCIDQNLVTNAAYAEWLDSHPSQDLRPAICRPESQFCDGCKDEGSASVFFSYAPYNFGEGQGVGPIDLDYRCPDEPACTAEEPCDGFHAWPVAPAKHDYPVVNVTWCDAYVYCAAHEKRLCGAIGGGPLAFESPRIHPDRATSLQELAKLDHVVRDPGVSEYANAMTESGHRRFPYGDKYDATSCPASPYCMMSGVPDNGDGKVHAIQSIPTCQGGYPGIFDLMGNAAEFIDACDVDKDSTTYSADDYPGCVVAGGFDETGAADGWISFAITDSNTGLRCCADAKKP